MITFFKKYFSYFCLIVILFPTFFLFAQGDADSEIEPPFIIPPASSDNPRPVQIMVIDSGFNPSLSNSSVDYQYDAVNDRSGEPPFEESSNYHAHGTDMVDIIRAINTDNDTLVHAVRIGDGYTLDTETLNRALDYAIENDADVVNMSFSPAGPLDRTTIERLQTLEDRGALVFSAASNEGNIQEGGNLINRLAPYTIPVGALDPSNNHNSITGYTSGVNTGRIEYYTSSVYDGGGTSAASAVMSAIVANDLAAGRVPETYDVNGDGTIDRFEYNAFANSPDNEIEYFIPTQSATLHTFNRMGYEYNPVTNRFELNNNPEQSIHPLAFGIEGDPETIARNYASVQNQEPSEVKSDLYRSIGYAPYATLLNNNSPYTEDEAYARTIETFVRSQNLIYGGWVYDPENNTYTSPSGDHTFDADELMNSDDYTFMQRTGVWNLDERGVNQLQSAGLRSTEDGSWITRDGEVIFPPGTDINALSEAEFMDGIRRAGIVGFNPDPYNGHYRNYTMQQAGYMLDDEGDWIPDLSTERGRTLLENGYYGSIPQTEVLAMSLEEFNLMAMDARLTAEGYTFTEEGWVDPNGNLLTEGSVVTLSDGTRYTINASGTVVPGVVDHTDPILLGAGYTPIEGGWLAPDGSTVSNGSIVTLPDGSLYEVGVGRIGGPNNPGQPTAGEGFFGSLVPCGDTRTNECTVCHLLALAQNVLNFLVSASVLVAALLFLNAGVLYVLSPSNPGNISKAHGIFTATLIGLIIILSAWLIINVIMETLYDGDWTQMFDMCSTYT